jgi:hypothetical protein
MFCNINQAVVRRTLAGCMRKERVQLGVTHPFKQEVIAVWAWKTMASFDVCCEMN